MKIRKTIVIIPARLESKRLDKKLLMPGPDNKPLLYHTWSRAIKSTADAVYIATDSDAIKSASEQFGATVIMTKNTHQCGTNRIEEAYSKIKDEYYGHFGPEDCIVNLQGDEPEIRSEDINLLIERFREWYIPLHMKIVTLAVPLHNYYQYSLPQNVKVVFDADNEAMFFSRGMIPWVKEDEIYEWQTKRTDPIAYKHIGIYAYSPKMLNKFVKAKVSRLESIENLEQMRAIENICPIKVVTVYAPGNDKLNIWPIGINTREDYELWYYGFGTINKQSD